MKILFFTPTGGRTGSEMVLWYLINHLRNTSYQTAVYASRNGELFAKHSPADKTYVNKLHRGLLYYGVEGSFYKVFKKTLEDKYIERIHNSFKSDLWYINTVTMSHIARLAQKLKVPYIVHVHELMGTFDTLHTRDFDNMLTHAKCVIACSQAAMRQLTDMGIPNVKLLESFTDTSLIKTNKSPQLLRQELGIPSDAFVWIMSGSVCMRKGIDFVPDLLQQLPKNAYLLWVGSPSTYTAFHYTQQRVAREQLNFIYVSNKSNEDYYNYLNMSDGFVLLSREEPLGLVMVEASYLKKPIVAFDSGGPAEFIIDGMGKVISCFDIISMASAMKSIMDGEMSIDEDILQKRALEFDVRPQLQKWQQIIDSL